MKLSHVIDELVEERGLDASVLATIISEGMLAAYKKKYPDLPIHVTYNKKNDEIEITIRKKIVSSVEDEDTEISLRKARAISESVEVSQEIDIPFDKPIGRIEILKAKQIIAQKIRSIEALAVYNEFKSKENSIVHGTIHKCEFNGITVKLSDTYAFLPKSLMIPEDKCIVGYPIRALLKDVLMEPRNENQLILDRISSDFLKKLFELEVPEVFEKLVEIKKIARAPGYKSKMVVLSHDKNIDPVGTCVGVGGTRIKPILKELGNEKIDIIEDSSDKTQLIADALKPAVINKIVIVDDKNVNVLLDEDQRALAIGKMGKNISLASELVEANIHLIKSEPDTISPIDSDNEIQAED